MNFITGFHFSFCSAGVNVFGAPEDLDLYEGNLDENFFS
jgi:hypothetical protein